MMSEPKPFASLSSSLLARKGQAKPAMRPQGFGGFGMSAAAVQHDDLGWNDMGTEVANTQPTAPPPVSAEVIAFQTAMPTVLRQQADLARDMAPQPGSAPRAKAERAAPGSKGKAAFTLRLDPERHLKLRLVCAVQHRSAQAIVAAALDAYLASQPAAALSGPASAQSR
ncbi:MAG: hypothetical protein ACKVOP_08380 [Sphingomonadaceae bacterium]